VTYDVLVVITAVVWLVILGGAGTTTVSVVTTAGALLFLGGTVAAWYWIGWCAMLVARVPGQFLCGWMLGRLLRRINPWCVVAGVVIWMVLGSIWLIVWAGPWNADYVAEIGRPGYVAQVLSNVLAGWAVVFAGTRLGRKGRQAADAKRARADGCPKVLSLVAASFRVGSEEVHEIGVLYVSRREIYTVDGRETLNLKAGFRGPRGSRRLSVGDREPHEIEIRWQRFRIGSAQALVDGEPLVDELFPDTRLLFRVMFIVLAVLGAGATAMGLTALTLLDLAS
jgi:hypothetical protein